MARTCVLWAHSALFFGSIVFASLFVTMAHATVYRCANGYAQIRSDFPDDRALICEAARRTARFAKSIGMAIAEIVEIEVTDAEHLGHPAAVGCFCWNLNKVLLRPSEQGIAREMLEDWGGLGADAVYVGFAAHEIMHAIASENFSILEPTLATQEYIAGVAQISVLTRVERAKILAAVDGTGFGETSEITLLAYQIDPTWFFVESYRHFLKPGNGAEFVGALLSGTIVLQDHITYGY